MRLFLTGEGPTDCGWEGPTGWENGPVQVYIDKISKEVGASVEICAVGKHQIGELRKTKRQSRATYGLKGHGEKAFFVAQAAADQKCDAVAMYVDADKAPGEAPKNNHQCRIRYKNIRDEVLRGLRCGSIDKDKIVAIVPMKMIECWILGDIEAFQVCFGKLPDRRDFRHPEEIWGAKEDWQSGHPKNALKRALDACGASPSRDAFVSLAEVANIGTLCTTCPISFADFYQQCTDIMTQRCIENK